MTKSLEESMHSFMYNCSLCGKKFKWESEKKRHELSHNPQYGCKICNKKFSFLSALRRHEKNHERSDPVQCKECGGTFRDNTLLKRHLKYAHNGETYNCPSCSSSFSSEVALRTHSKIHKGKSERRYKCSFEDCDKTFNFPHHLKHHELAHTGSKQHYCTICGKGFIQAHHLKTHLKGHEPGSWMPCTVTECRKKFSNKYALKRHLATHRNKELHDASESSLDGDSIQSPIMKGHLLCDTCGQLVHKTKISKHLSSCQIKMKTIKEAKDKLSVTEEEYSNTSLDDISEIVDNKNLDVIVNEMSMIDLDNACHKLGLNLEASFGNEENDLCINMTKCMNSTLIDEITPQELGIKEQVLLNNNEMKEIPFLKDNSIMTINNDDFENNEYLKENTSINNNEFENNSNILDNDTVEMSNLEYGNSCKNVLGACLVETDEKCICAKMYNTEKVKENNDISIDKCNKCDNYDWCKVDNNKDTKIINNNKNTNEILTIENNNTVLNTVFNDKVDKYEQVPFNSCKAIFGNCIVSGNDTIGEECLCAKMYNDGSNSPQEIEDITPFTQMTWNN